MEPFLQLFRGRTDCYVTYDTATGKTWQVKRPVTRAVYRAHLDGDSPLAVYPIINEDEVCFGAIDFDEPDGNLPLQAARSLKHHGFSPHVEISRSKGFHVWVFFDEFVKAWQIRGLLSTILTEIEYPSAELFPKQDRVLRGTGNCLNLPLFGAHIKRLKTVFVNGHLEPVKDQQRYVTNITADPSSLLENWCLLNHAGSRPQSIPTQSIEERTYGLRACAQHLLEHGITGRQRVTCFWLAVQLRKAGIPFPFAIEILKKWAQRNPLPNDKARITYDEVEEQTRYAYNHTEYMSCGCHETAFQNICGENCITSR